jgi:hypothetical protein
MNKQATENASELSLNPSSKGGFFERALLSQFKKINRGSLQISTPSGSFCFGENPDGEIRAEIVVEDPIFFRKA